jgi:superfamily I DNA/RNA helicase
MAIAEEKRLFYVAITRAKDILQVSSWSQPSDFLVAIDNRN